MHKEPDVILFLVIVIGTTVIRKTHVVIPQRGRQQQWGRGNMAGAPLASTLITRKPFKLGLRKKWQ